MTNEVYHIEHFLPADYPGIDKLFQNPWILWVEKYQNGNIIMVPVYKFHTIAGFWCMVNQISVPSGVRIIIMREGIMPFWEDPHHINGGYAILNLDGKINNVKRQTLAQISSYLLQDDIPHSQLHPYAVFLKLLLGIVGEKFCKNNENITGIMYIDENGTNNHFNFKQIRFWLGDYNCSPDLSTITEAYLPLVRDLNPDIAQLFTITPFSGLHNKNRNTKKKALRREKKMDENNRNEPNLDPLISQ